jgi:hypothetical protein
MRTANFKESLLAFFPVTKKSLSGIICIRKHPGRWSGLSGKMMGDGMIFEMDGRKVM